MLRCTLQRISPCAAAPARDFSKFMGKTAGKYKQLNSKHAKKGYYKGNRSLPTGRHTSKGHYRSNPRKNASSTRAEEGATRAEELPQASTPTKWSS